MTDSNDLTQSDAASASEAAKPDKPAQAPKAPKPKPDIKLDVQPVLQKLFELYPHLFGSRFLPLKLGTFQDLMAAHPGVFQKDSLKAALGFHARSTRYLQCVVAGNKRHDLQGNPVEDVAPEHVYVSLLQLFSRRQSRSPTDLRASFRAQLIEAFEASGLSRQEYQLRVQTNEVEATQLLEEALVEYDAKFAKQTALKRAFESSGKSAAEFADMYGLDLAEVEKMLRK
jgi:ProP effector